VTYFRDHTLFTRLRRVNVAPASDMTKTLNCTVIVSGEVCKNAGIAPDRLIRTEVSIRGRDQPMTVCTAGGPDLLASLLDEQAAASGTNERELRTCVAGNRCRCRLKCNRGIAGTKIKSHLSLSDKSRWQSLQRSLILVLSTLKLALSLILPLASRSP